MFPHDALQTVLTGWVTRCGAYDLENDGQTGAALRVGETDAGGGGVTWGARKLRHRLGKKFGTAGLPDVLPEKWAIGGWSENGWKPKPVSEDGAGWMLGQVDS